jgi:UDP-MurNAc hydroxylase
MKITHLQSSTQIIHLGNVKVLTDPWLTDGEYYGSWYHYPPFGQDNLNNLDYDFIYVSHIHPDHLSEETFRKLPKKKPVLIHNYDSKFVNRKLEMLGYEVIECDHGEAFKFKNGGSITIYAADNCSPELCGKFMGCAIVETKFGSTQIDTLAVFQYRGEAILNINDCPFELAEQTIKANQLDRLRVNLLLVGYAGAGPYPQCFYFDNIDDKKKAADAKEKQFLAQATKYIDLIKPDAYAPFAGTYILGSNLSELTKYRGVPSMPSAMDYLKKNILSDSNGVLLEKLDVYDVSNQSLSKSEDIFDYTYNEYLNTISGYKLIYEDDKWDDEEIPSLMNKAYERFSAKAAEIGFKSTTTLIVQSDRVAYKLSTIDTPIKVQIDGELSEPLVRITVDHNLLHRLLRGPRFAHWNNAEIGSHLHFFRKPNTFERDLYHCMCFLHQ